MTTKKNKHLIFFSAAEASGDKHASGVIRTLRQKHPNIACDGLGGQAMQDEGCKLIENLVSRSAMLTHAIGQVGFYYKLLGRVKKYFQQNRPDLVVLVDSPAWNFHVAKAAKAQGIPVLYYIAPQLWAWGQWRVNKTRKRIDRLACILPFEQDWFAKHNIKADFVGHPLFDEDHGSGPYAKRVDETETFPVITLLPGSRKHEIERLWQPMQEIAIEIKRRYPTAKFQAAALDDKTVKLLESTLDPKLNMAIRKTTIENVTRNADLTLVASGTATLEVAAQHSPMIVMYHVNKLQWYTLGKLLLNINHISLVNILADHELVPEFVPCQGRTKQIIKTALEILDDEKRRADMKDELFKIINPIVQPGVSDRVVNIIEEMLPKF